MSRHGNPVEARGRTVRIHPDLTPDEAKVDLGGTLEFTNHSDEFPDFEISFDDPGPPNDSDILTGTKNDPVFVHMPDVETVFYFHILYKGRDAASIRRGPFRARSCPGCSVGG